MDICEGCVCRYTKESHRFIEIPYQVELCAPVWFILRGLDDISLKEYKVTAGDSAVTDDIQFVTELGTYGFWVGESPRELAPEHDDFYRWYEVGETVFFSREEAEDKLKEYTKWMKENGIKGA